MTESTSYDIAVSFAEEQRAVVDEVVEACRQRGLTVLESNDLPQAEVRFLVPFVSTAGEVDSDHEHVLPVLTGETTASSPHVTFLRADEHLVDTLVARVEAAETAGRGRVPVTDLVTALKQPARQAPFSGHAEQNAALRRLAEQFAAASPALAKRGLAGTMHMGGTTVAVRVERAEDTVYALEVRRDGVNDDIVNFVVLGGSTEQFSTLWQRIEDMLSTTA
ncbi:hypothetical protein SAMN05216188_117128 [Lentzea xinjiangensis]|uniref:DUF2470 domain-containing protein n=1 Tax=Lentzea xinjiangensis TaxID=402600 RepID=A0A1H9T3D9_9PSEU|nr:hypothetical protein [Lentzea xinjiangensis]SER91668.1 hypothetical protein SAMN05216188_117128 [Lentzea xinjiangensis]